MTDNKFWGLSLSFILYISVFAHYSKIIGHFIEKEGMALKIVFDAIFSLSRKVLHSHPRSLEGTSLKTVPIFFLLL